MALQDEIRDARRINSHDEEWLDEIERYCEHYLSESQNHLHYNYGFSGDYFPQFLDIISANNISRTSNETDGN